MSCDELKKCSRTVLEESRNSRMMNSETNRTNRRTFIGGVTAAGVGSLAQVRAAKADTANEKLVVGVMGMGGRGGALAKSFHGLENVEVAMVCDVDRNRAEGAAKALAGGNSKVEAVTDFRRILDNRDVDVLVIATCNHWHAPAAIMGCAAGKHVYVEKPCSHNAHEGELLVAASKKHKRLVQHGTQRRSWPKIVEGIRRLREEKVIGRIYHAHCHYTNRRKSIGVGKVEAPPAHLDFDLWQGPAPRRPFKSNMLHYNWHWLWHWGNGELGNNGVHYFDVARWGMEVDFPTRVYHAGSRYRYQDDQETPDTCDVTLEFGEKGMISWRSTSCAPFQPAESGTFVTFTGEDGTMVIKGSGYVLYDGAGKEVAREDGPGGNDVHTQNFVDAIRIGTPLAADASVAHVSALHCHLGNISHLVDRRLKCNPEKGGVIMGDDEAMGRWKRDYEPGWEPKV